MYVMFVGPESRQHSGKFIGNVHKSSGIRQNFVNLVEILIEYNCIPDGWMF